MIIFKCFLLVLLTCAVNSITEYSYPCVQFGSFCIFDWSGMKNIPEKNWTASYLFCSQLDSHLLNNEVNVSLTDLFGLFHLTANEEEEVLWIGLKLINGSLTWEKSPPVSYVTGMSPLTFGRFDLSEQNDRSSEKCAALYKSTGLIKMIDCSTKLNFTCFRPPTPEKVPPKCTDGWEGDTSANKCYKVFDDPATHQIATNNCLKLGGDLADYDKMRNISDTIGTRVAGEYFVKTKRQIVGTSAYGQYYGGPDTCKYINFATNLVYSNCVEMKNYICERNKTESPKGDHDEKGYGQDDGKEENDNGDDSWLINSIHYLVILNYVLCPNEDHKDVSEKISLSKDDTYNILHFNNSKEYYKHLRSYGRITNTLYAGLVQGEYSCERGPPSYLGPREKYRNYSMEFWDIRTDYLYVSFAYAGAVEWTDMYSFVTFDYLDGWRSNPNIQKWLPSEDAYLDKILNIKMSENKTILDVKINLYWMLSESNLVPPDPVGRRRFLATNSPSQEMLSDSNVQLKSSVGCYKEVIVFGSDRFFFDVGLPSEKAFSDILCQTQGLPVKASAECIGNFTYGYSWVLTEVKNCISFDPLNDGTAEESNITKNLFHLFRNTSAMNFSDVLDKAKNIFNQDSQVDVQSKDISLAAAILEKSKDGDIINSNTGRTMVEIVNSLLDAPIEQFQQAQQQSSASISIMNSVENLVNKFVADDPTKKSNNITLPSKNLAIHFFESTEQNSEMGFGLLKSNSEENEDRYVYAADIFERERNNKLNEPNHIEHRDNKSNNLDDLEVFLLLPRELYTQTSHRESTKVLVRTSFIVYKSTSLFDSSLSKSTPKQEHMNKEKSQDDNEYVTSDKDHEEVNDGYNDDDDRCKKINSMVIMSSVGGRKVENLSEKIKMRFRLKEKHLLNPTCMYARTENGQIRWLTDGLMTIHSDDNDLQVQCESNHLTNFAVLAGYHKELHSKKVDTALRWVTIIGLSLSIVCLFLVIIGQILFKKLRRGQFHIALFNLSIALVCVNFIVLFALDKKNPSSCPLPTSSTSSSSSSSSTSSSSSSSSSSREFVRCIAASALLHYFLLVSFAWMLVESILQYYKFIKVFNTHISSFIWKTVLPTWILPAILVIITLSIDYKQFDGFEHHCWLAKNAFYFSFLLPLGLIMLSNACVFVRIIKGVSCDRPQGMKTNQSQIKLMWLQVQAGIGCFIIMGLTWTFAFFAYGSAATVMYFLFAIFNSLQGVFICVLFNLRDKSVRRTWTSFFRKQAKNLSNTGTSSNTANFYKMVPTNTGDIDKNKFRTKTSKLNSAGNDSSENADAREGIEDKMHADDKVDTFRKFV